METEIRDKQQKRYTLFRITYDVTMAILFLAMAFVMFFAEKFHVLQVLNFEAWQRIFFGGICLLYGAFRLYRGINRQY